MLVPILMVALVVPSGSSYQTASGWADTGGAVVDPSREGITVSRDGSLVRSVASDGAISRDMIVKMSTGGRREIVVNADL
jgi:hypothetical protein